MRRLEHGLGQAPSLAVACGRKPRGEHHGRASPARAQRTDDVRNGSGRRRDDREVGHLGQAVHVGVRALPGDLRAAAVDRIDRPGEPATEHVADHGRADASLAIGRPDHGDRLRAEQELEIADRHERSMLWMLLGRVGSSMASAYPASDPSTPCPSTTAMHGDLAALVADRFPSSRIEIRQSGDRWLAQVARSRRFSSNSSLPISPRT